MNNDNYKDDSNITIKSRKRDKLKSSDNCSELKNIAYKTMLQNGMEIMPKNDNKYSNDMINNYLNKESAENKLQTWTKLDKTQKILKLNSYIDFILKNKFTLSDDEIIKTKNLLSITLDRKLLNKTKDVSYDKDEQCITNIPNLYFLEESRNFVIKKCDKHVSTSKSLAPLSRKNRTAKQH